jgi:3-methylcrotonyl-CoA carboxylase alpha subunit
MEMNTRLQVEHPVTEEITGQDLVEWHLRVASGEPLPLQQDELSIDGWAMEARLYAEDPSSGFLPSVGKLEVADFPDEIVRVETGVEQDDAISPYYDPMIAKLIATGEDRSEAMMNLAASLYGLRIWPVKTNAAFLLACLQDPNFQSGEVTTSLIADRGDALTATPQPEEAEWKLAALQSFAPYFQQMDQPTSGPWLQNMGFRLNAPDNSHITLQLGGERRTLDLEQSTDASGFSMPFDGGALVYRDAQPFLFTPPRFGDGSSRGIHDGEIVAPMPGKVTAIDVSTGDKVVKGQRLLTLEAMKMEHGLTAPFDGVVAELNAAAGDQVKVDAMLIKIESSDPAS